MDFSKRNGFKETEIGMIPEDWEVKKISEITNLINVRGRTNVLPYIEIGDIDINSKNYKYKNKVSVNGCKKAFKDNLIISKVRPTRGAISLIKEDEIEVSSAFTVLSAKENADIEYIFLTLAYNDNFFSYLGKLQKGSNYPSCRDRDILDYSIPLPPLSEQKKIAAVLSAVQEAKEKTEAVIKATKELKKSLMKHLFTYGPISPKEAGNVALKETEIGMIPEDWEVKRLGESIESIDYGYSISIPANKNDEGIPIISTADITENGRILYNKVRKINPPKKITEKLLLKNGDVLFNWRNSPELVGKTAIFELKEYKNYIYASFILRIRCDEIRTHNVFLKYLLSYYRQIGVFFKLSRRAVNQSNYNKNEIYVLLIPLPPLPIQQKIAEILSAVDEKIEAEENKKKSLEDLFKTLLNNLMTGKIRVNNLEV